MVQRPRIQGADHHHPPMKDGCFRRKPRREELLMPALFGLVLPIGIVVAVIMALR